MVNQTAVQFLSAAVACSTMACGSATPSPRESALEAAQVVVLASPPVQVPGPVIAAEPAPIVESEDLSAWVGVWQDDETQGHVRATVRLDGRHPTVVDVTESEGDKEHFELRSTRWEDGVLSWSEYVPSTQYLVSIRCTGVAGDSMDCTWSNDHGAKGEGALKRIRER
jgi:hypothetical protein